MKALTICQPYAHLIAIGEKLIEYRTWYTSYRGPLLIHAGLSRGWLDNGDEYAHPDIALSDEEKYPDMAFGAIVCKCQLEDVVGVVGDFRWVLGEVKRFATPVPYRGKRGLFDIPDDVIAEVRG